VPICQVPIFPRADLSLKPSAVLSQCRFVLHPVVSAINQMQASPSHYFVTLQ